MRILRWAALALLAAASITGSAQASILNGSFETGDFTSWMTAGNTSVVMTESGVSPTDGTYQGLMTNLAGSVSASELESFANLGSGRLDAIGGGVTGEGSGISQLVTVGVGDVLSFDWKFLTNEVIFSGLLFDDFAFVSLVEDGTNAELTASVLASFSSPSVAPGGSGFLAETDYLTFEYTFASAGTFLLTLGVADSSPFGFTADDEDTFNSALLVDNFVLERASTGAVPEPGTITIFAAGASILGGLGYVRRRRRRK